MQTSSNYHELDLNIVAPLNRVNFSSINSETEACQLLFFLDKV